MCGRDNRSLFFFSISLGRLSPLSRTAFSSLCGLIGVSAVATIFVLDSQSILLPLIALAAFAFAIGLGFSAWLDILSSGDFKTNAVIIIAAHIVEALLQLLLQFFSNIVFYAILIIVLMFLNFLISQRLLANKDLEAALHLAPKRGQGLEHFKAAVKTIGQSWQLIVCIATIAFALEVTRTVTFSNIELAQLGYSVPAFGKLIGGVLLLLLWKKAHSFLMSNKLFFSLYLLVIVEFALLPIFHDISPLIFLIACGGIFNIVYIIGLISCTSMIKEKFINSVSISTAFFLTMYLGGLVGGVVGRAISQEAGFDVFGLLVVAMAVICITSLGGILTGIITDKRDTPSLALNDRSNQLHIVNVSDEEVRSNEVIRKKYGLSNREVDILLLLMGARSVSAIASQLYISENTVRGHMKHIYTKMDVHSRQELLDLVALILDQSSVYK